METVVVADPLAPVAVAYLRAAELEVVEGWTWKRTELLDQLEHADALLVRSGTRVDGELLAAAPRLRVVGRAGVGVDNIDLEAATRCGIVIFNVPSGNLLSAAEHTFALMLAVARKIAVADAALKQHRWDRKAFLGDELHGKTLGIIGLGRIGRLVASRARAFGMHILAHDPFLSPEVAARIDVEAIDLDPLLERSDVVTLHVPLSDETHGMIGERELALLPPGAMLVNCARGGLVDEHALLAALDAERLTGAGLDVLASEPPMSWRLVEHPRTVATPHLGAQTRQAQERVALQAAETLVAALGGSLAVSAVNLPFSWDAATDQVFLRLAEQLGLLASELVEGPLTGVEIRISDITEDQHRAITLAAVRGALLRSMGSGLSYVNVEEIAAERGIRIVHSTGTSGDPYSNLVRVRVEPDSGEDLELAGTVFDARRPRVVRLGGHPLEFDPSGRLLVLRTEDVPGVVGQVGTLLGEHGVNIADIHLARRDGETDAWTVLRLDQDPSPQVLEQLGELPPALTVRSVDLGDPWGAGGAGLHDNERTRSSTSGPREPAHAHS